jgi:cytochrome c oxidase cbb3-type subunit 2
MNHVTLIFLGLLVTFVGSWTGMVVVPQIQLGREIPSGQMQPIGKPPIDGDPGDIYPQARVGLAEQGRQLYRKHGCYYCHSQQVNGSPTDLERWTKDGRFSVHRDYLFDQPALFGPQRLAPDLSNVGARLSGAEWHLMHLYAPQLLVEKSSMPPYPELFERRTVDPKFGPSPDALPLTEELRKSLPRALRLEANQEVVPKEEAKALVAFLLSLRQDVNVFEAPMYAPKTNAVDAVANGEDPAANCEKQ